MSIIEKINDYEYNSSLANENRRTDFYELFVDSSTLIACDIPAIDRYNESISVTDYVNLMSKFYNRIGVDIKIKEISKITYNSDNTGKASVFVTKKVKGPNVRNKIVVNNSDEFINYEDNFNLEINIVFDEKGENLKISGINFREKNKANSNFSIFQNLHFLFLEKRLSLLRICKLKLMEMIKFSLGISNH